MIIPVHHIVVYNVPVQGATTFEAGQALALDTNGYAVLCDGGSSVGNVDTCVGLAADRNRSSEAYEYVNRVSDMGNEAAASGLVSVYTGGIFYVDVDEGTDGNLETPLGTVVRGVIKEGTTVTPGTPLYVASGTPGYLTHTSTSTQVVAHVIETSNELGSGIPGEYEPGSSLNLVDDTQPRQWVKIKLAV